MAKVEALYRDTLEEGPSTPGITRRLAFKGDDYKVIRSRSEPGVVSGWHHHGDYDVYGYVVSGSARFESGEDHEVATLKPGDFFHVPPHTVHRESNPSADTGNEMILFLRGAGPLVTNLEGPDAA